MDVYTYYSPSHAQFFQRYLCPTAAKRFDLLPLIGIDRCGTDAWFGGVGWAETCIEKMRLFRQAIGDRIGDVVVFSDPDVIFANVTPEEVLDDLGAADISGQRASKGSDDLCAGFFALRISERTLTFLDAILAIAPQCHHVHDQEALNRLRHRVNHRVLADRYWHYQLATGKAWDGNVRSLRSPPDNVAVVHATWVNGRRRKIRFLDWIMERIKSQKDR